MSLEAATISPGKAFTLMGVLPCLWVRFPRTFTTGALISPPLTLPGVLGSPKGHHGRRTCGSVYPAPPKPHQSFCGVAEGLSVTRKQAGDRWLCLRKAAINTWGSAGSSGLGRDWGPGRVAPSNPKIPRDLPGGGFSRHRRSGPTWAHHSHRHHRKSAALRSGFTRGAS